MSYFNFKPYVPVAKRRAQAETGKSRLEKKLGRQLQPVRSEGRKLAQTWWGKAWNQNLESYSDYANRLPRGRSYLSNGSVLDLQITQGKITALVQGSDSSPYEICITIAPLAAQHRKTLTKACAGKLQDVQQLLAGKFPTELGQLFLTKGKGLFPANKEIHIQCDCPDWAGLCKHAAATLYGVGVRLDQSPELFFTLRGLAMEEMIGHVVQKEAQALAHKADHADLTGTLVMDDNALAQLFDIDLAHAEFTPEHQPTPRKTAKKSAVKKITAPKTAAKKKVAKKAPPQAARPQATAAKAPQKIVKLSTKKTMGKKKTVAKASRT